MFLRAHGVRNGTLGTLERIEGASLTVRLDAGGRSASERGLTQVQLAELLGIAQPDVSNMLRVQIPEHLC